MEKKFIPKPNEEVKKPEVEVAVKEKPARPSDEYKKDGILPLDEIKKRDAEESRMGQEEARDKIEEQEERENLRNYIEGSFDILIEDLEEQIEELSKEEVDGKNLLSKFLKKISNIGANTIREEKITTLNGLYIKKENFLNNPDSDINVHDLIVQTRFASKKAQREISELANSKLGKDRREQELKGSREMSSFGRNAASR